MYVKNRIRLALSLALLTSIGVGVGANAATLKVSSFPSGAEVLVDGAPQGLTPATIGGLSEGVHQVTVQIVGSSWRPATTDVTVAAGNNDLSVTLLPEADITSVIAGDGLVGGAEEGDATLSLDPAALDAVAEVVNNTFLVVDEAPTGDEVQFVGTIAVVSQTPGGSGVAGATAGGGTGILGQVLSPTAPAVLLSGRDGALAPRQAADRGAFGSGLYVLPAQGGGGIAGEFINETGGQILSGQAPGGNEVFAVQGDGTTEIAGDLDLGGDILSNGTVFAHGSDGGGSPAYSTAIGFGALSTGTSGGGSTAVGFAALQSETTGYYGLSHNTAVGKHALTYNTSGYYNVAVGVDAMRSHRTGGENTALGRSALGSDYYGTRNTALGNAAMAYADGGSENTAVGSHSLFDNQGFQNVGVGTFSLHSNTTGSSNVGLGADALRSNTTGFSNTAVGAAALNQTSGVYNTALGANAGSDHLNGDLNLFIDNRGQASDAYTIRIGTAGNHHQTYIAGVNGNAVVGSTVVVDASGQLGVAPSSRRYKEEIRDLSGTSQRLLELRPVSFLFKKELVGDHRRIEYGLIAEEVAEVFPDLVTYDDEGRPRTVRYELLSSLLLGELQRQHDALERQRRSLHIQEERLAEFLGRLDRLEAARARASDSPGRNPPVRNSAR